MSKTIQDLEAEKQRLIMRQNNLETRIKKAEIKNSKLRDECINLLGKYSIGLTAFTRAKNSIENTDEFNYCGFEFYIKIQLGYYKNGISEKQKEKIQKRTQEILKLHQDIMQTSTNRYKMRIEKRIIKNQEKIAKGEKPNLLMYPGG